MFITIYGNKNVSVSFRDSVTLDPVARTVQSFAGFEIESEGVLAAADHLVPDIASFQGRSLMRASSLNSVEDARAA